MKKVFLKAGSLILGLALLGSVFAGCGKNETGQANSATNAPSAGSTAVKGPTKIKMMNRVNVDVKLENNPYISEIEKVANVKLEIEAPPINNYNDRLQIVMASGDYPDLVYIWQLDKNYEMWASDDILQPLDDKISKYPNLMSNLTKDMWEVTRTIGTKKIHGVPKANKVNRWGLLANQLWLDKLGLKAPTSTDELYEAAKAIATKDPDGNGKADTFAMSPYGLWNDQWLLAAFNLNNTKEVKDIDGKYKGVREKAEGYYPYLTYMRKLYAEKLIDPEFFLNKVYNDLDKQLQNRVAFTTQHDSNLVSSIIPKDPEALKKFSFYPPLANQKGEVINNVTPAVWGAWTITKGAKNVDGILKFLDWGNSKEGFILMNIGVKGVHYDEYDFDKKLLKRTQSQTDKTKVDLSSYTSISYAYNGLTAAIGDTEEKAERYTNDLQRYLSKTKEVNIPSIKYPKLDLFGADNPDLIKKREELETKYVTGDITLEQLKSFVDKEFLPKIADAEKEYLEIMKNIK